MPDRSGFDILKALKHEQPHLPVLVLSIHAEEQLAIRALKAGASGYLTKEKAPEELVKAIRKVVGGGRYISRNLALAWPLAWMRPPNGLGTKHCPTASSR